VDPQRGVTIQIEGSGHLMGVLLANILEMIRSSGANDIEAKCALEAAIAVLPEMGLERKPTMVFGDD
jgi:hypothetical protein